LSEEFIAENSDKVDWYCISANQSLSIEFIKKNIDKLNIQQLKMNKKINKIELEKIM
jgi:hypothetical protein